MINEIFRHIPSPFSLGVSAVRETTKGMLKVAGVAIAVFALFKGVSLLLKRCSLFRMHAKKAAWEDSAVFKADLIERAWKHFGTIDRSAKQTDMWKITALQVNEYFQSVSQRLETGENVPIPIYYHASREGADYIARDALLKQSGSSCFQGSGVYFSTNDESTNGYGPVTFALDPSLVENASLPVTYDKPAYGPKLPWEETALWMCASHTDIHLDPAKVALVVVEDGKTNDKLEKYWHEGSFFVTVIERPVANEIRRCIQAVHTHMIPDHWCPYRKLGLLQRSWNRTFATPSVLHRLSMRVSICLSRLFSF